jgi:STE24 endopeptidase
VAHLYTPAEFEQKRSYNLAKLQYSMVHNAWDVCFSIALLLSGYLPATWRLAGHLLARWGWEGGKGEIVQSVVWTLIQAGVSLLLGLPWSAYSTFVLEASHGFNKTSLRTFTLDLLKSLLLGALLLPPVVAGFTSVLSHSSPYVALYLWAFLLALSLFALTVYPTLIAPLFNTFKPLEQGELRQASVPCCAGRCTVLGLLLRPGACTHAR